MASTTLDASKHQLEMASEMDGGLLFDEKVSEIFRNYPCLYDKRRKDYKDKNVVAAMLHLQSSAT